MEHWVFRRDFPRKSLSASPGSVAKFRCGGPIASHLYGLKEGTQELTLEKDKYNVVTIIPHTNFTSGTLLFHL